MTQFMDHWGRPIMIALVLAFLLFVGGRAMGVWDALLATASSAVSETKFEGLEDSVREQGNKLNRLNGKIDRLVVTIDGLKSSLKEVSDAAQDFKLTRQTVGNHSEEISRLRQRGGYVWDSVNRICERLDMICATRNALWSPGNPYPQPDMYALRYAYHKTPAVLDGPVAWSSPVPFKAVGTLKLVEM